MHITYIHIHLDRDHVDKINLSNPSTYSESWRHGESYLCTCSLSYSFNVVVHYDLLLYIVSLIKEKEEKLYFRLYK